MTQDLEAGDRVRYLGEDTEDGTLRMGEYYDIVEVTGEGEEQTVDLGVNLTHPRHLFAKAAREANLAVGDTVQWSNYYSPHLRETLYDTEGVVSFFDAYDTAAVLLDIDAPPHEDTRGNWHVSGPPANVTVTHRVGIDEPKLSVGDPVHFPNDKTSIRFVSAIQGNGRGKRFLLAGQSSDEDGYLGTNLVRWDGKAPEELLEEPEPEMVTLEFDARYLLTLSREVGTNINNGQAIFPCEEGVRTLLFDLMYRHIRNEEIGFWGSDEDIQEALRNGLSVEILRMGTQEDREAEGTDEADEEETERPEEALKKEMAKEPF